LLNPEPAQASSPTVTENTFQANSDREKTAHLLRRFAFGASEAELDYYLAPDYAAAVDRLLNFDAVDEGFDVAADSLRPDDKRALPMPVLITWWASRMLVTRRPLQEKLTLFWHDHFATSASKVKSPYMMLAQNETLRANATGNFRELLTRVSQDPAMLQWLDNQENVKGKPNENFARELMELFTLGIDGGYTETDVREAARAFTGWSYRRGLPTLGGPKFLFRANLHDVGAKEFLGARGNFNGEDVINHLCTLPRSSRYITEKLIRWFVTPTPEPAYVDRMDRVFRNADLEIKPLLRAIMLSPEFVAPENRRKIVKNPADFCITTARQLGYATVVRQLLATQPDSVDGKRRSLGPAYQISATMKNMGMHLMYPPDVAGWDGGQAWISSATMVERIAWADKLFGTASKGKLGRFPAALLPDGVERPADLVNRLASIFDAPVAPARRSILESAAEQSMRTPEASRNPAMAAAAVTRLLFATPEFQFA
jgi:uncharacterized protein (DUF1800 family)